MAHLALVNKTRSLPEFLICWHIGHFFFWGDFKRWHMFQMALVETVFVGLGLTFCSQCLGLDPEAQRFIKMCHPRPLFPFFCLFKQTFQFLQQINMKKCPSSIWCQDSNPRLSEHESPPITTRPGLPRPKDLTHWSTVGLEPESNCNKDFMWTERLRTQQWDVNLPSRLFNLFCNFMVLMIHGVAYIPCGPLKRAFKLGTAKTLIKNAWLT